MQRGKHQTEFANGEVNEGYDADEQQPRGTSQLHGPNRLNLSDLAPDNKADQRLDSWELCETVARCSKITKPRRECAQAMTGRVTDTVLGRATDFAVSAGRDLIEIVVRIAHVRVFRLVTDFRREFRVTAMDVRNV